MKLPAKITLPPYVKFGDPDYLLADKVNEVVEYLTKKEEEQSDRTD